MAVKKIVCTVTNDLTYDQRMIRICTSLAEAGYTVQLIGRKRKMSIELSPKLFQQTRLPCFFDKGKLFYLEYNIRLFIYLLFVRCDVICAIDLDTILPCLWMSSLRRKKRVYDAHELFCEMDEIVKRPTVYKIWKGIEAYAIPKFPIGYTIGECYAEEFKRNYGVHYGIVRNATRLISAPSSVESDGTILYQGAVNEGRSFETLLPAMQQIDATLIICGDGNYFEQVKEYIAQHCLQNKIICTGYIEPQALKVYTQKAYIGITLFTSTGRSNYLSLANRFFDYMHAGIPQICMAYPEYVKINAQFEVACLLPDTNIDTIVAAIQKLLTDPLYYQTLKANCFQAREVYSWQQQEITLLQTYSHCFE